MNRDPKMSARPCGCDPGANYRCERHPMPSNRDVAFEAISLERQYQDTRWNSSTTTSGGQHSVAEFLVYMRDYVEEALHFLSRHGDPEGAEFALHSVRKVTALGIACMEQRGVRFRDLTTKPTTE